MKDIINWGILGCSRIATQKIIPAVIGNPRIHISAIASRNNDTAEYYCRKFGIEKPYGSYDELLDDPSIDAVYISLPNSLHCEWSIKAAQKGKNILCEKPAGITPEEIIVMLNECKNNKVLFLEGFMYRFHPQHKRVKDLIKCGVIGEVNLVTVAFSYLLNDRHSKIKLDKFLGGGCLLDIGCYCVDLCRLIFESEPEKVFAEAKISPQYDVDVSLNAVLSFPGDKKGIIDCSFEMFRRNSYKVVGTKGEIYVPNGFSPAGESQIRIVTSEGEVCETFSPLNLFFEEFLHFSQCLLQDKPLVVDQINCYYNGLVLARLEKSYRMSQLMTRKL